MKDAHPVPLWPPRPSTLTLLIAAITVLFRSAPTLAHHSTTPLYNPMVYA